MSALAGKRALVTGGASGIGLSTARELTARGARVLVVDIQDPPADLEVAAAVRADVRDPDEWRRIGALAESELGGLDYAFLNAGVVSAESDIAKITDDDFRRTLEVSVNGVFYGTRTAVPLIAAAGGGAIVATSSLAGLIAFSPDPVYTMAKHGVVGLVRALAGPLGEQGITINALCPAIVDTAILNEERRAAIADAEFPMMTPEEITASVIELFLGEESGGAYVCQYGQPAVRYRYRGVPGPAGHQRPPSEMSGI